MVWLAEKEEYLPADAASFVDNSELWFDSGLCGKKAVAPQPTATGLAEGTYETYADVITVRAMTEECQPDDSVRYTTNESKKPDGAQGFYLDVSDDSRHGIGSGASAYWEFVGNEQEGDGAFIYWLFYAYNDFANNHEADWERVAVRVDNWRPTGMTFKRHDEPTCYLDSDALHKKDGRLLAWSAKGSHGSYSHPGSFAVNGFVDRTSHGTLWDTRDHLVAAKDQPWWGYRGLWGDAQVVPGFTGIAGPNADREDSITRDSLTMKKCESIDESIPKEIVGKWKSDGYATQVSYYGEDWSIKLEIFGVPTGGAYGVVRYPELDCEGNLTLIDSTATSVRLQEVINLDPRDTCVKAGVMTLSLTRTGLSFDYVADGADRTTSTASLVPA